MLPTAGLFLPETLHRRDDSTSSSTDVDSSKLKYFQWRNPRTSQETRISADQTSIASSVKILSPEETTNEFSSLATAFSFADFVSSSNKASSETVSFAQLIKDVQRDISEASRLYLSPAVSNFLDAWPDKRTWVDKTLLAVRSALNDIGVAMDSPHLDGEENSSSPARQKFEWFLGHHKRLSRKQQQLKSCHHDLQGAIHVMQTVELCGLPGGAIQDPIFEAPSRPWMPSEDKNALRGPYSRQRFRMGYHNLSSTSIALSEGGKDNTDAISTKSEAIELPGSTPDDLRLSSPNLCPSPRLHTTTTALTRSRAHSDHGRPFVMRDVRSSASLDVPRPLAALPERTIERNDSTTSTTAMITVPLIAKRYRAQAVNVHRQTERHRSLPSELPCLASQSSLVEDLADYVLPSANSDQLPATEWDGASVLSMPTDPSPRISQISNRVEYTQTPSTAISGGFQELFPLHDRSGALALSQDANDKRNVPMHRDNATSTAASIQKQEASSEQQEDRGQPERTTLLRPVNSLVSRKPVPPSSNIEPSLLLSKEPSTVNLALNNTPTSEVSSEHSRTPAHQAATPASYTTKSDPEDVSNSTTLHHTHERNEDAELSLLQQRMLNQTYVKDVKTPTISLRTPEQPAPPQSQPSLPAVSDEPPPQPDPLVPASPDTSNSKIPVKPMSAQAKRQAAHRRRMEMAFGKT